MSPHVSPSGRSRGARPAVEAPNRGKNENFFSRDAVDPLGDRVVGRLVVLRHADRGFNGL